MTESAPDYSAQQFAYQEGQRQRFLQQQYQRVGGGRVVEQGAAFPEELQQAAEEGMPDHEMTDYIQEEDEEEDPYYFVQPQQRPHGNIYQAARVGDTERVRYFYSYRDQQQNRSLLHRYLYKSCEVVQTNNDTLSCA